MNTFTKLCFSGMLALAVVNGANAQTQSATDTMGEKGFKPHGQLWGYAFGDFAFKAHADTVGGGRGGTNQYSKVQKNQSMFQFRRIYLGYNYDISPRFSAEFLLAAEDNTAIGGNSGDLLSDGKFSPYIKLANIRYKRIYPGADLVLGQAATPAFPLLSEVIWGYRSVERTVADLRRTPSFDLGATIQGRFIPSDDRFGYDIMVGNGQSAKPENDAYKWFYGDVYGKFLNKRLIVDLYQDYQRMNWTPTWHHDRRMTKLYVAYTTPKLTIGVEAFYNVIMGDVQATGTDKHTYNFSTKSLAVSSYIRGSIYKDKLGFFARYDTYNPDMADNLGDFTGSSYTAYSVKTSNYDPFNNENFITAGIDWTPVKNVHFMPNVWYNSYAYNGTNTTGKPNDYDLVFRLTFYYIYGK